MTILFAGWNTIDVPLKGARRLYVDSTRKGYSTAALLQPLRAVKANKPITKEHHRAEVQLHKCCEELGTRVNK